MRVPRRPSDRVGCGPLTLRRSRLERRIAGGVDADETGGADLLSKVEQRLGRRRLGRRRRRRRRRRRVTRGTTAGAGAAPSAHRPRRRRRLRLHFGRRRRRNRRLVLLPQGQQRKVADVAERQRQSDAVADADGAGRLGRRPGEAELAHALQHFAGAAAAAAARRRRRRRGQGRRRRRRAAVLSVVRRAGAGGTWRLVENDVIDRRAPRRESSNTFQGSHWPQMTSFTPTQKINPAMEIQRNVAP